LTGELSVGTMRSDYMKVILLENVKSLGLAGEVLDVTEGYARNFLFPQHLAVEASAQTLQERADKQKRESAKEKRETKEEKKLAAKLDGFEVIIQAKASEGKLYAAVGVKDVVAELKNAGFQIQPEWITFSSTKEPGTSEAVVNLPSGFDATISVVIEAKSK